MSSLVFNSLVDHQKMNDISVVWNLLNFRKAKSIANLKTVKVYKGAGMFCRLQVAGCRLKNGLLSLS